MKMPTIITKIGKAALLVMVAILALGSAPSNAVSPKFLATSDLQPVKMTAEAPVVVQERVVKAQTAPVPKAIPKAAPAAPGGSLGFVMAGNNCVVCVRAMTGRSQNGNAGTWRASHSTPNIGDIMIWRPGQGGAGSAGHVGVVKGINADGTVNIAHCNWPGQTRFASTGLFW